MTISENIAANAPYLARGMCRLVIGAVLAVAAGCEPGDGTIPETTTANSDSATTYTYVCESMTCEGCEQAIVAEAMKVPGVSACNASHVEQTVVITAADEEAAWNAVERVNRIGYTITAGPSSAPAQPPARSTDQSNSAG